MHHEPVSERRKILFSNGFWWFSDPECNRLVQLDPLFEPCEWKVGLLCRSLGVGQRTFARALENGVGITCKTWLRNIRIIGAGHLLREGYSIKYVANRMGFRHQTDFTLEFRKLMGVLPSFYVKAEICRSFAAGSERFSLGAFGEG